MSFSSQTEVPDVSSLSNALANGSVMSLVGKRLSAGKAPVSLFNATMLAVVCKKVRNFAAAALLDDHEARNSSEDWVVSYVLASLPVPHTGGRVTPTFFSPTALAHARTLPSVVNDIAALLCGKSCQPSFSDSDSTLEFT